MNPSTHRFMKTSSLKSLLLSAGLAILALPSTRTFSAGTAVYWHDPKEVFISPGLGFFTTLRVVAGEHPVGAFSVVLHYDTNALHIQQIVAAGPTFADNLFPDYSSFQSGATRLVGFRTASTPLSIPDSAVCHIVWRTVGTSNRMTQITSAIEKHVTSTWKTDEVWSTPASVTVDATDTDNDGLPDWWERLYFGTATAIDAQDDPDEDGVTNLQEYRDGTSPLDAAHVLRILTMELAGADVRIGFSSQVAKSYQVEWCDDLARNTWTAVGESRRGSGGELVQLDPGGAAHPLRFYRVRIVP